ncbi:uncharacterized protein N7503_000828 [Penicillium pulvis]|uniref:uncharacterized protein n=1 Tax=Penicillium pulvis TaxID=1562058 RepID=UPI00254960EC|nr:uncharacterized protein N7503_000828 [Penicillium pulvis]KAJ5814078.1 hypothetical protein N7503_000828 [Penicillium pulvis]
MNEQARKREQAKQRDERSRNKDLRRIRMTWKRIAACESFFLSPSDLQRLGVEARQVENTDDGDPQFEPRFFEPHPAAGVLQQYPIDPAAPPSNDRMTMPLWCIPTLQEALATVQERFTKPEDPLKAARELVEEKSEHWHSFDHHQRAFRLHLYITSELDARRKGGPPGLTLQIFETVKQFMYVKDILAHADFMIILTLSNRFDESLMRQGGLTSVVWKHHIFHEEWDYICHLPLAFCTIEARVDGILSDQKINIHEMRAIMRMNRIRFRGSHQHSIYPFSVYSPFDFLLMTYMGKQQGRTTQIVVQDGRITIQYSKLWSFEVRDTAPVEIFIRYRLSRFVGFEARGEYSATLEAP